jgi:hypothetical protein
MRGKEHEYSVLKIGRHLPAYFFLCFGGGLFNGGPDFGQQFSCIAGKSCDIFINGSGLGDWFVQLLPQGFMGWP